MNTLKDILVMLWLIAFGSLLALGVHYAIQDGDIDWVTLLILTQ